MAVNTNAFPRAVCINLDESSKSVVKSILGPDALPIKVVEKQYSDYTWNIQNKYYKADVLLSELHNDFKSDSSFEDSVEAVIIKFDSKDKNSFKKIAKFQPLLTNSSAEIQLLICDSISTNSEVKRKDATDWCIKSGFELIDLNPEQETSLVEQDVIIEKFGVERIIEALESHLWPNAELNGKIDIDLENEKLDENAEIELDSFNELFSQLNAMKEGVQSMPGNDRLRCAEQVAMAFWNAIGGDTEELDDFED